MATSDYTRKRRERITFVVLFVGGMLLSAVAFFYAGMSYSRNQVRQVAAELEETNKAEGTNSFTKCLVESWELSGELGDALKKNRWVLKPVEQK